jgi:hypothetical protein
MARLERILAAPAPDLDALRNVCWNGIPNEHRPRVWRILCGLGKEESLARKRTEYAQQLVPTYYHDDASKRSADEEQMWHQIAIDVPRTCPSEKAIFSHPRVALAVQRILYIWALKHPATGYVQGINDLITPFLSVFLREHAAQISLLQLQQQQQQQQQASSCANGITYGTTGSSSSNNSSSGASSSGSSSNLNSNGISSSSYGSSSNLWEKVDPGLIDKEETWLMIEADTYWCFTKFADPLAEHYTFAQPGIQKMVFKLEELTRRLDSKLYNHLISAQVQFLQFGFRWCNCLLLRELPLGLSIRLFDTYLSEGAQFVALHVYVCAALLLRFGPQCMALDFTECVMFLQNLPTQQWTSADIDVLLSQAYVWKCMFEGSQAHLQGSS